MKMRIRYLAWLCLPSLLFLIISFVPSPALSQDGWSRLYVDGEWVSIFRDEFGVPHILAESAEALFEAFGYVVAQDRLTQLELSRRQAQGRLAEILGPKALERDISARRDGYTQAELQQQHFRLRAETRRLIAAYARGINRWMALVRADRDKRLPRKLWQLGITEPEPWSIYDSLAIGVAVARRFGQRGGEELKNLEELERLGWEEFERKYPLNDPSAPTTIALNDSGNPSGGATDVVLADLGHLPSPCGMVNFACGGRACLTLSRAGSVATTVRGGFTASISATLPGLPERLGSYAVVVSSGRSASGRAMLLGCPQMGFKGPQPGYEIDLHGGGFDVAGMTFPGVPAVLIGYNKHIAWTVTSGLSDTVDIFIEELNPENPRQYRFGGEWRGFESREEVFRVRGLSEPLRREVYRSIHGPVFKIDEAKNLACSMKRTFWGEELKSTETFLQIDRAGSLEDFAEAVGSIALSFNLFCAASDGQIGFWHMGKYRIPAPGVDPRLPASGTGQEEWRGFVPRDKLPHIVNPREGLIVNWNNKPSRDWDNGDNIPWVGGHRVSHILDLLRGEERISLDELKAVPEGIGSHGTYQQVVELTGDGPVAFSILPPGESGFVDKNGVPDPHSFDQAGLFNAWQYKPAHFMNGDADRDGVSDRVEAQRGTNPFGK